HPLGRSVDGDLDVAVDDDERLAVRMPMLAGTLARLTGDVEERDRRTVVLALEPTRTLTGRDDIGDCHFPDFGHASIPHRHADRVNSQAGCVTIAEHPVAADKTRTMPSDMRLPILDL